MISDNSNDFMNIEVFKPDMPVNILSVDDQPKNLLTIESILEEDGLTIISKTTGQEALKYLLEKEVAVILLDVRMPIMDGLDMAALVRQRKQSKDTPIIFLTAELPSKNEINKAYALGAVDYITKPIVPEILYSKVSVFIDLYRKTSALRRKNNAAEREAKQLRTALESLQMLNGWQDGNGSQLESIGPLRTRSVDVFQSLQLEYEALLDDYLEAVGFGKSPPRKLIKKIAEKIGALNGGARDVIDIHQRSVANKCQDIHPRREQAYALEGRLLALEMMGFLVDYFRLHMTSNVADNPKVDIDEPSLLQSGISEDTLTAHSESANKR